MSKAVKSSFVCQSCGAVSARWAGKCGSCGDWNTIVEEVAAPPPPGSGLAKASKGRALTLETLAGVSAEALADAETALLRAPRSVEALFQRARALEARGQGAALRGQMQRVGAAVAGRRPTPPR